MVEGKHSRLRRIVGLTRSCQNERSICGRNCVFEAKDLYGAFTVSVHCVFRSIEEMTMLVSVILLTAWIFTKCLLLQLQVCLTPVEIYGLALHLQN